MSGVTVGIVGGLFAADLLERVANGGEGVDGQRPQDFGLAAGTRMSDEIQDAFSRAVSHWATFQRRRLAASDSVTTVTRQHWVKPLLEDLGFELVARRAHLTAGGQGYGIAFTDGEGETAVPIHVVPFDQDLDRRGERERLSPHGAGAGLPQPLGRALGCGHQRAAPAALAPDHAARPAGVPRA